MASTGLFGDTLDLGAHRDTSSAQAAARAVRLLEPLINQPECVMVGMETQLDHCAGKPHDIVTKIHNVQGAIVALCMLRGKPLRMVSPQQLKQYFHWRYMGGYAANKQWALDTAKQLYPEWYKFCPAISDHAADAKLIAHFVEFFASSSTVQVV